VAITQKEMKASRIFTCFTYFCWCYFNYILVWAVRKV